MPVCRTVAWEAYRLGVKITMDVYGVDDDPLRAERQTEVLREIADGRLTLHISPADRTAPYPNMNPTLREFIHDNANELVQREREVAKLIWGVIEGLGGDQPRNWDDE